MTFRLPGSGYEPPTFSTTSNNQPTSNNRPKDTNMTSTTSTTPTMSTLTLEAVNAREVDVMNRLNPKTIDALNSGTANPDAMTAIVANVSDMLPTLEQVIDTPQAVKIVQAVEERLLHLNAENYVRFELNKTMREMYRLTEYNSVVVELEAITASPAAARIADLKAQHENYRAGIQTALEAFAELANEYADEQNACGQFERAMSVLWAIAPRGYDSMPRRTVSETVRLIELVDIELPRDDEGDADYSAMDADEIREHGWSHGVEVESY